jgi:hypothetical protein
MPLTSVIFSLTRAPGADEEWTVQQAAARPFLRSRVKCLPGQVGRRISLSFDKGRDGNKSIGKLIQFRVQARAIPVECEIF